MPFAQWMALCLTVMLLLKSNRSSTCTAQRFMRQGLSNNEDFGAEMKLDESEGAVDMSREMFLMKDMEWEIQPIENLAVQDPAVQKHIQKYLARPVELKLFKKRGKYGLRAVGRTATGQKLRAFWRQAGNSDSDGRPRLARSSDFLTASYDDAVRARLFTVEFELQLPPVKKGSKGALPSVVYQFSVEPGSMNPKALVPRGVGRVSVFPAGRSSEKETDAGSAMVGAVRMKPGLVDPGWAKGRPIFRRGRKSGLM